MKRTLAAACFALSAGLQAWAQTQAEERWDKYVGQPSPRLVAAGWSGTPVSLDAVKGNTVVLAFWNADVPC